MLNTINSTLLPWQIHLPKTRIKFRILPWQNVAIVWTGASGLVPSSAHSQLFLESGTASPMQVDTPTHLTLFPNSLLWPPLRPRSAYMAAPLTLSHAGPGGAGMCVWEYRPPETGHWEHVLGAGWSTGSGWMCPLNHGLHVPRGGLWQQMTVKWQSRALWNTALKRGPQGRGSSRWKLYFSGRSSVTCYVSWDRKG